MTGTPGGTLVGEDQLRVRSVPEGVSIKLAGLFGTSGVEKVKLVSTTPGYPLICLPIAPQKRGKVPS